MQQTMAEQYSQRVNTDLIQQIAKQRHTLSYFAVLHAKLEPTDEVFACLSRCGLPVCKCLLDGDQLPRLQGV
jgi:hypothetical protein